MNVFKSRPCCRFWLICFFSGKSTRTYLRYICSLARTHSRTRAYTQTLARTHIRTHAHAHTHTHTHTHIHAHLNACTLTRAHACPVSLFYSPFRFQARYVITNGYGGVMTWTLDLDDFAGKFCGHGKYPLWSAVNTECQK